MSRYDIEKFDPPPDPDLVCCICQCVLDKAVECPCRHVFCQSCIERWLTNRHTCPTCRKRTLKQDLKPVLPLVQNMLNRLLMICEYRDNGCIEKIMLEHFDRHVKNCGYEMKTCRFSKCGVRILRMNLEEHENVQCEHRETVCEGECGLMIPLSDRPTHNCVTALKAHIDEKNRMIEQLKVKLHELNNLSQSLNDQLFELRQQLNDRTHSFSSASSISSDSSESVFIDFNDQSRDSFRDVLFDSAASSISADNFGDMDNAASNDANHGNNNNGAGNSDGSDVVEQVERTMENRLFELSSRLERVRNQMRGVLNSRLVHDQNNTNGNGDVRFRSAAELDALVNNGNNNNNNNNNDNYNAPTADSALNQVNNNMNEYPNNSFERQEHREDSNSDTEAFYYTDDDTRSNNRYSYANHSQSSVLTEENHHANAAASDVSDLNWISDTDTNPTPDIRSPSPARSPFYERYTPFRNENHNHNNQYISEHVILSQPPDSPSDTTGSFSSIPSTSSVAFSPLRLLDTDHDSRDAAQASNNHSSPDPSDGGFSSENSSKSPTSPSPKSPDSSKNDYNSEHGTSFTISSPAHSVSSATSSISNGSSKSEASHASSDEDYASSVNTIRDSPVIDKSDSNSSSSIDSTDSDADDVRNVKSSQDNGREEKIGETSHIDSSLDYEHSESHEENGNLDHSVESTADEVSQHEENHDESDDAADTHYGDNVNTIQDEHVSRCEPDSTQSPSAIQQQQNLNSSAASSVGTNRILISTATESTDSDNWDSSKSLTRRVRHSERPTTDGASNMNESTDAGSVVDSGFITGSNSPTDVSQPSNNCKKGSGRKRRHAVGIEYEENKKSRFSGDSSRHNNDQKCQSYSSKEVYMPSETVSNNSSYYRYGFRRRMHDNDHNSLDDSKKFKGNGVNTQHLNAQMNSHRSRTSPPRNRQPWREPLQHMRRNRASVNRWNSQSNDNNGQSLNVKIDLSLINYSGHLGSESASTTIPTATVVHSANISPIPTASTVKRETALTNARQNMSEDNIKSSTPKQEETTKRIGHRQRSSRSLRHETLCSTRNTNSNSSPGRGTINISNTSNRDFPNSWRDSSESSSDNTWEPGTDCDEMEDSSTEVDDGFETESSYEVQIPKSTAALLDEYASDESDESWTVGMT